MLFIRFSLYVEVVRVAEMLDGASQVVDGNQL
jgi:hypothetical protein